MRNLGRAMRVDLFRSIFSKAFLLTVCLVLAWMCFNCSYQLFDTYRQRQTSAPKMLNNATCTSLGLAALVLSIATVPYTGSYLQDRESGFESQTVARVGFQAYGISKILSVALSAFLSAATAICIFLAALYVLHLPEPQPYLEGSAGAYLEFAGKGWVALYYLARITVTGMTCALAAVFGLMVTTWIPNIYVGLLAPLVGYYLYYIIYYLIGTILRWPSFYLIFKIDNILFFQVSQSPVFSLIWAVIYLLTLTALCGKCFLARLREEQGQ